MEPYIFRATLLVLWWIGVWGLAELLITTVTRGSVLMQIFIYMVMITTVISLIYLRPDLVEHF
jgi:hypothetical protein